MKGCDKCCKMTGLIFLVVGVLFLLGDLGVWDFWNIQWWTALFIIIGVSGVAMGKCKACQEVRKK